jgi:hypothetical protein
MATTSQLGSGAGRLPLSALVSQVLVAFIIEFDNEFERQMPHRTTDRGKMHGTDPRSHGQPRPAPHAGSRSPREDQATLPTRAHVA